MAHTLRMTVNASLEDADLILRILNFKEDVHRELIRGRSGAVTDASAMDRVLASVTITIPRQRHFDQLLSFVAEASRRHEVGHAVQVAVSHS